MRIGVSEVGRQRLFTILQHELRPPMPDVRGKEEASLEEGDPNISVRDMCQVIVKNGVLLG